MSADLGSAHGSIELDISSFSRGIAAAQAQATGFGRATASIGSGIAGALSPLDDFASRAQRIGGVLDAVAAKGAVFGGAIALGVGVAVRSFASFERQINQAGVVSGATGDQLEQLSSLALQLGKDTSFGATEAAQALTELAKAGVPLETILNGAGEAAVNLAAATGTDLASSANILANTLNVFAQSGLDAADAVDILTAAANASSANIGTLAAGLRVLGPVVSNLGGNLEDAAASIAFFTNFGLKAADAGISLARALDRAAAPSKEAAKLMERLGIAVFDAQGAFVGFPALFDNLKRSLGGLSDEQRTLAIATIFGAEAQDVINIAVQEGAAGYEDLRRAVEPAGQAAASADARMKGLAGSLEQMRGSLETAAIAAGEALAPAIASLAGLVESAADAFSALPGPVQETAVAAIAAAGGLALVTAAVAKTISFALESAVTFRRMAQVIRESAIAMRLLSLSFGPIGLAVAALAVGLAILVKRHHDAAEAARRQEEALRRLGDATKSFAKFIDDLRLQGFEIAADAAESLATKIEGAIFALSKAASTTRTADATAQDYADALRFGTINSEELTGRVTALTNALGEMEQALRTPGIDVALLARDFDALINQLITGEITVDQFAATLEDITTHLVRYKDETADAADGTDQLTDAQLKAADAAEKAAAAQAEFASKIDGVTRSAIQQIKGLEDASDALDGMQTGYRRAGESTEDLILRMDRLNKINLSDAEEEALHLANHLIDSEQKIEGVTAAIQNNQEDMSMWSGRISTVTDVLGGNTEELDRWLGMLQRGEVTQAEFNAAVSSGNVLGNLEKLDALLASGAINQDTYNRAKEAGLHLIQRSAGGIQDENAELVDNLIALDAYVTKHDEANGAVEGLNEQQRGFLAAMNSSSGALALQTLQLLVYLAAIGAIPEEKVTQFVADSSAADPVVSALFGDLDLLDEKGEFHLKPTGADAAVEDIAVVGDALNAVEDKDITITTTVTGDGTSVEAPGDQTVEIKTVIAPPDDAALTGYQPQTIQVKSSIIRPDDAALTGYKPATIHVPTQLDAPTEEGGPATEGRGDPILIPTKLGAPDTAALDDYAPATLTVPTKLGTPSKTAISPEFFGLDTMTIPTKLGTPSKTAVSPEFLVFDPVVIPTFYGTPSFPEGAIIESLDPVTIDADAEPFYGVLSGVRDAGDTFAEKVYDAELDGDKEPFDKVVASAATEGVNFSGQVYEATLDADANPFYDALRGVRMAAETIADKTYSVTISADTSLADAAIQDLANRLPSSPAKEGPLSKTPSFDYVTDAFVRSMLAMQQSADRSLAKVTQALDDLPSVRAAKASLFADMGGWLARESLRAPVGGGGTTIVNQHINAPSFAALHTREFSELLDKAETGAIKGGEAHRWIAESGRAGLALW